MELSWVRTALVVARSGSFTGAAGQLHLTQSAVSRHVANLEDHVGTTLFTRHARGVQLTAAGHALLDHGAVAAARLDQAVEEARLVGAGASGLLRLGAVASTTATVVPHALAALVDSHPALRVGLREARAAALLAELAAGLLDAVLVHEGTARHPSGTEALHLADDPWMVALPADHPLAGDQGPLPLSEVVASDLAWVELSALPDTALARLLADHGTAPRVVAECRQWTAKLGFVAAGLAVCLLPGVLAGAVPPGVVARPLDVPPRSLVLVVGADAPPAATTLLHALRRTV